MIAGDLDRIAMQLLLTVADASARALLLAGVAAVLLLLTRPRRPAVRLAAWAAVLYSSLALPVLGVVLPAAGWSVPISVGAAWTATMAADIAAAAPAAPIDSATTTAAQTGWSGTSWVLAGSAAYVAGLIVLLGRAMLGWRLTRRLVRDARPIDDGALRARLERRGAGLTARLPRLAEVDRLRVPVTTSVANPIVLLPSDWREWTPETIDAVLAHEAAHAARRDTLTQRVSIVYRALTWCSPFSWWLHRRLCDLAEEASDVAALEAGAERTTYARALVDFLGRVRFERRRAVWHVAMARRAGRTAERRIDRILSWRGTSPMPHTRLSLIALAIVATPIVALTAALRPDASRPTPTPGTPVASTSPSAPADASPTPTAAPAPVATGRRETTPAAVRPAMSAGDATRLAPVAPDPSQRPQVAPHDAQAIADFRAGAHGPKTPGVTLPIALNRVHPKYTSDAMRAKLQGTVEVEIVVEPDGSVSRARIVQSLDSLFGLDDQALDAARQWTFIPGKLNEEPVAVYVSLRLEFRLH